MTVGMSNAECVVAVSEGSSFAGWGIIVVKGGIVVVKGFVVVVEGIFVVVIVSLVGSIVVGRGIDVIDRVDVVVVVETEAVVRGIVVNVWEFIVVNLA